MTAFERERADRPQDWILRRLLFSSHSCDGKYGDDGELQCSACGIDFRRDTPERIDEKLAERGKRLLGWQP